jgi:universal bacterial protein YeaZ
MSGMPLLPHCWKKFKMDKPIILNIDTATEDGGVSVTVNGELAGIDVSRSQKDHASWIQVAIQKILKESQLSIQQIDAVAVTAGPGSYTGLRVGMATAKGICYALQKPLITVNTLEAMAFAAREQHALKPATAKGLYCPMIDARRMEVFTAIYDDNLHEVLSPIACELHDTSFTEQLDQSVVFFFGSGSGKWKHLCKHSNARFAENIISIISYLGKMATGLYIMKKFADVAYENPVYLKEFYSHTKK